MDYIQKIKIAASLCGDVANIRESEYMRGICEFIADTEELDIEVYGEDLASRRDQVFADVETFMPS